MVESKGYATGGGLEAATRQPQATYDGEYLYDNLFAMAATYAHGIAERQAFLDVIRPQTLVQRFSVN